MRALTRQHEDCTPLDIRIPTAENTAESLFGLCLVRNCLNMNSQVGFPMGKQDGPEITQVFQYIWYLFLKVR